MMSALLPKTWGALPSVLRHASPSRCSGSGSNCNGQGECGHQRRWQSCRPRTAATLAATLPSQQAAMEELVTSVPQALQVGCIPEEYEQEAVDVVTGSLPTMRLVARA